MDAYIYQGDIFCEDCARKIKHACKRAGKAPSDPEDESSYDSDDYPKGPYSHGGGDADSPQHCAGYMMSGGRMDPEFGQPAVKCVNRETLRWRGKIVGRVGAFLQNDLTHEGLVYLCEMISERGASDYQKALHKLWIDYYRRHGYKKEIAECVREEMRR